MRSNIYKHFVLTLVWLQHEIKKLQTQTNLEAQVQQFTKNTRDTYLIEVQQSLALIKAGKFVQIAVLLQPSFIRRLNTCKLNQKT